MPAEVRLTETRVQGFRALKLSNALVSLTLLPELGGKINSIRDLQSEREWLWTNKRLPYRKLPYGTSYVQHADVGGWDECFPTVAACAYPLEPWRSLQLPDHGEIWPQEWSVKVETNTSQVIRVCTEVQGIALPYLFQRTISLTADAPIVRFDYTIKSLASFPLAFIWSAHPLFAIEAGMRILLPEDTRMQVWLNVPSGIVDDKSEHMWPVQAHKHGRVWDLSHVPEANATIGCKLWSQPLSQGYAALLAQDGEFRFIFDPAHLPQIGVWINAGAWSGMDDEPYYNLALEPCIGAQDSLKQAIEQYKQYGTLLAHEVREWWLEAYLNAH